MKWLKRILCQRVKKAAVEVPETPEKISERKRLAKNLTEHLALQHRLGKQEISSIESEYRKLLKEIYQDLIRDYAHPNLQLRSDFCKLWRRITAFTLFDVNEVEEEVRVELKLVGLSPLSTTPNLEKNTIQLLFNSPTGEYARPINLGFIFLGQ